MRISLDVFVLLCTATVVLAADTDELLSARCQARCLRQLELKAVKGEERRQLKHHIINLCKDDQHCSSCVTPCREAFVHVEVCKANTCKETRNHSSCHDSCQFLQRIYAEKPGACPKSPLLETNECVASCQQDGDCPEAEKCCRAGCGQACARPTTHDARLLPLPIGLSVQERRRKRYLLNGLKTCCRSAIVRWVMRQMKPEHTETNSNLFVLQWRWGVHMDSLTPWQTITVRNKMYAIIKHLLSPGRFYVFRVAAVNVHGSRGFSASSAPFKLSKEARAPPAPRHFVLGAARVSGEDRWTQQVKWQPPVSDLPIVGYVVSWWPTTANRAAAFEESLRRRLEQIDQHGKRSAATASDAEDADDDFGLQGDQMSVVVAAHTTDVFLDSLIANSVYEVEVCLKLLAKLLQVHATVDSTDGVLQGEKATLFLRTMSISTSTAESSRPSSTSTTTSTAPTLPLEIQTPYLDNNRLKTAVSWLNTKHCSPTKTEFLVSWSAEESCGDRADFQVTVSDCAALLDGLQFSCRYLVRVTKGHEEVARGSFTTDTCQRTPSSSIRSCEHALTCSTTSTHAATCSWHAPNRRPAEPVIGYRIVLSSSSSNNITINPPSLNEITYENLRPGQLYSIHVQAITSLGLGETFSHSFRLDQNNNDDDEIKQFRGEMVELPLESGVAATEVVRWTTTVSFLLCLLQ